MKKIFSIIMAAALTGLFMASCSSDNDYTDKVSSVQVEEATTDLPVRGGSADIIVTGKDLSATSADSWLSVSTSGNVVTVTADGNDGKQSRHTLVTVTAANGDQAIINVSQAGLVIINEAELLYVLGSDGRGKEFFDMSNVDYDLTFSDDWIHLDKSDNGYTVSADNNTTGKYRRGTIHLKYKHFIDKTIYVGQWSESYPFTSLNTATYEDEEGNTYTKSVSVVADEKDASGHTYIIKGLLDEGDIPVTLNTANNAPQEEYCLTAGYTPGTLTEDGTTYTLRCLLSAYNVNTGNRYYPTQVTTSLTSGYRMAFGWVTDDEANASFSYIRNYSLSQTYRTDGIIVCKFSSTSGASAGARKGIAYAFLNLKLTAE